MSSISTEICVFCYKECRSSDSRPFPSSKSKERIHTRCQIKKSMADKRNVVSKSDANEIESSKSIDTLKSATTPETILERLSREESELKKIAEEKRLNKLIEESNKKSSNPNHFFDVKAGVVKSHEKKRYLHHRNLSEIAARFDDQGFQEEAVGRAYDHTGRDLNTLGDDSGDDDEEDKDLDKTSELETVSGPSVSSSSSSRKFTSKDEAKSDFKRKRLEGSSDTRQSKKLSGININDENPCWFCLSSPHVEKHLVIAIGEYCYLTLAKGGLNDGHLLVVPIEHIESLNDEKNSLELLEELENFKSSLVKYYAIKSMGVVFFERNFRSVHWQLQVVPIPLEKIDTVEQDIKTTSKKHFYNADYIDIPSSCSLGDMIPPKAPYFYWQVEPPSRRFVTQIRVKGSFFPVQIGRIVLADEKILNCPDKIDWRRCLKTREEYEELAKRVKSEYREFDLT